MGKKNRIRKRETITNYKNPKDRQIEIDVIKKKLDELGLGNGNEDILKFYKILESFVDTGENSQGKIEIKGYKRIILYILNNNQKHKCKVELKYQENI